MRERVGPMPFGAGPVAQECAPHWRGTRFWRVDLDGPDEPDAQDWLSPTEVARAHRFVFPRDARRYRIAHVALRQLLFTHAGVQPDAEFELGAHDKPVLCGAGAVGFNLSHSGGTALIGIGACTEIGVDIEKVHAIDDIKALAERNFSAGENEELRNTPAERLLQAFLSGWTRKEACLKALGTGLSIEPGCFETGLAAVQRCVTIPTDAGPVDVCVRSLDLGPGMLAAVAHTVRAHSHGAKPR